MAILLLITLSVMAMVLLIAAGIYQTIAKKSAMQQRLDKALKAEDELSFNERRMSAVNKKIGHFSIVSRTEKQLIAADSKLTPSEYFMIRVGLALLTFIIGRFVSGYIIGGMLLAVFGWMGPAFYMRRQRTKRSQAFEEQLPDMLSLVVGSLRAGYGLLQACNLVQQEMPDPISTEFARVIKETTLGVSVDDALDHLVERIDNDDLKMIVTSIHIQNEVGGSLADVLETVSATIRERIKLRGEIRVMTTSQRFTGWILSALPFGMGTVLMMLNPEYMMEIFQPGLILAVPIGACVLMIMGNIVMNQLMKIEV